MRDFREVCFPVSGTAHLERARFDLHHRQRHAAGTFHNPVPGRFINSFFFSAPGKKHDAPGERRNAQKKCEDSEADIPSHFRVRHTFSPFTVLLIKDDELLSYYTTPQAKKQGQH